MKVRYSAIALAAVLVTVTPVHTAVSQDKIPELQRQAPKDTTLTGCVARGAAAGTYILTNITREGETETAAQAAPERMTVVLSGRDIDVSGHVDHRVSVTGAYAGEVLTLRAPGEERSRAAEVVSQSEKKAARTFRVKSLAMLATSCSQPTGS